MTFLLNKIINGNILISEFQTYSLEILKSIYNDFEYITNLTKEDQVYLSINEIYKCFRINMNKRAVEIFKDIPYYISQSDISRFKEKKRGYKLWVQLKKKMIRK